MSGVVNTSAPHHLRGRNPSKSQNDRVRNLVLTLIGGGIIFYAGMLVGIHFGYSQAEKDCSKNINKAVRERLHLKGTSHHKYSVGDSNPINDMSEILSENEPRFDPGIKSFAVGMTMVPRDKFAKVFEMGVPVEHSKPNNQRVLILHSGEEALPKNPIYSSYAQSQTAIPFIDNVEDATENCATMSVILTKPAQHDQCIAIMGQFQSYHVQRFMRIPPEGHDNTTEVAINNDGAPHPLRLVNRDRRSADDNPIHIPTLEQTEDYVNKKLIKYLDNLGTVLEELKPIAEKTANGKNTIIVMAANYGHSELLLNFVCNAKAKGINLDHILVFATDVETKELARGIGLETFYDETNFHKFPKPAAQRYADRTFAQVMIAKIFCVHMLNQLGYNVIFQDVDMIWYRNPLEYFNLADDENANSIANPHAVVSDEFDMYFQEDGSHSAYYEPFSANTGFYLVKYNERTRYFLSVLLMSGDLVAATGSHQKAVMSLLSEHASMYGLRVKILPAEDGLFPGGYTFHNKKKEKYMKDLLTNKLPENQIPYIFHMSYTHNKDYKDKFFKQMGQWYLKEECVQKEAHKIVANHATEHLHDVGGFNLNPGYLQSMCCSAEPVFSCHFRDKPSMKSCSYVKSMDKDGKSFW